MTLTFYKDYMELFNNCVWYNNALDYSNIINPSNNGTASGATLSGTNRFGLSKNVHYFNGSSYMDTLIIPSWSTGTILFWISNLNLPTTETWFAGSQGNGSNGFIVCAFAVKSTYGFRFWLRNNANTISVSPTYNITSIASNWNLIGVTFNGTTLILYINGIAVSSASCAASLSELAASWSFGEVKINTGTPRYQSPGGIYYQGESMIFNTALSTSQINILYNLMKSKYLYPLNSGKRGVE